tara:strand:- start:856 stop:1602 length:747 start_codon:yes stop_codon:yes gene_type:complete
MSAKRFIDNSILPKAFRKLKPSLKLHWYYIWNHCDKSGVWEIDEDLFEFENGIEFMLEDFLSAFENLIEKNGEKILVKDFIRVNYGDEIKDNYNPHKPVLRAISKNKLKLSSSLNQASFKLVDEEEDVYEEEKEKEGVGEKTKPQKKTEEEISAINYPWPTETFKAQWKLWKLFKKKKFKFSYLNAESENRVLTELKNLSGNDEKKAIKIIQQSIDNGWKGFFELKKQPVKPKEKQTASKAWREKIGM